MKRWAEAKALKQSAEAKALTASSGSFGPHIGSAFGEWQELTKLAKTDRDATWARLLEITAMVDDAGLFWVADILEDLVLSGGRESWERIESELLINLRLRQAFVSFVPLGADDALEDHMLDVRERIEAELSAVGLNPNDSPTYGQ